MSLHAYKVSEWERRELEVRDRSLYGYIHYQLLCSHTLKCISRQLPQPKPHPHHHRLRPRTCSSETRKCMYSRLVSRHVVEKGKKVSKAKGKDRAPIPLAGWLATE